MNNRRQTRFTRKYNRKLNFYFSLTVVISLFLVTVQPAMAETKLSVYDLISFFTLSTPVGSVNPPVPEVRTVPPVQDPHLPSLSIQIALNADSVTVGDIVTATVTLSNIAPDPANSLVLSLPTPEGVQVLPGNGLVSQEKGWQWNISQFGASSSATYTANMQVTTMPTGQALVLKAQATAQGLLLPVIGVGGALVADPATTTNSTGSGSSFVANTSTATPDPAISSDGTTEISYDPTKDTLLKSADGKLEVKIPAGAYTSPLKIKHSPAKAKQKELTAKGKDLPPAIAGFKKGFGTFFLDATDDKGKDVHKFNKALTITLHYTPQQLAVLKIAETDLTLFWFDESKTTDPITGQKQSGQWSQVISEVDEATHTVIATLDHFTGLQFSDGSSPSASFIPSVQGWQESLYTGATSYNYPIELPAGPNGIKPNLSLSYSSAASDGDAGSRFWVSEGWVGKGWSLDTGAVSTNKTGLGRSYFSLVFDGASFDIIREEALVANANVNDWSQWAWRPTDESFIKVRYVNSPGKWQVWAKNGTLYEFSTQAIWGFCTPNNAPPQIEPYTWKLTTVTDTHGNRINYTYGRFQNYYTDICHLGVNATLDHDIWPQSITWGGNVQQGTPDRYRLDFVSNARTFDSPQEQVSLEASYLQKTRRLDAITVFSNRAGSWETVRQYNLCYAGVATATCNGAGQSMQADYDDGYGPYWKLSLRTIQRIANDGTTALPATTFTYGTTRYDPGSSPWVSGSWNRLISADNGQGGVVNYAYEEIGYWLQVRGYQYGNGYKNNRRITSKTVTDGRGHSYTWNYSYGLPAYNTLGIWNGTANVGWRSPNATMNSAAQFFNVFYYDRAGMWDYQGEMVHPYGKEFRGHASATVTDPNGTQAEHYFYQGDHPCGQPANTFGNLFPNDPCFIQLRDREFLKGKEWLTRVRGPVGAGSPIMSETWHNFTVNFYDYGPNAISGLWRAFSYESQTVVKQFEGSGTPLTRTTNYLYNADHQMGGQQYGNLSLVQEYDQNGQLQRYTSYWYATRNDANSYLVDRKWAEAVLDGQNNWKTFSFYFYDGLVGDPNVTGQGLGSKGELTLTRQIFDLPATLTAGQPLHGIDTSFGYDVYGNPTSVTTYTGNGQALTYTGAGVATWNPTGWVFGSAGNGASGLTTTTSYDGVFHVFPTQITQPPATTGATPMLVSANYDYRMGTLTTINDENNVTSNAEYDLFGRMTKLIKPGDSSSYPTQQYWYADWEQPFRYEITQREASGQAVSRTTEQFYDGLGRQIQTKQESLDFAQMIVTDKVYDGLGHVTQLSQPRYVNESGSVSPYPFFYYTTPSPDPNIMRWTTTTYDALGRPSVITAPDGSYSTHFYGLTYEGSLLRGYHHLVDANRHIPNSSRTDEFGRLVKVYEYSGNCGGLAGYGCGGSYNTPYAPYAITTYNYSELDQLKQVTDNAGNITTLNYDSLGRKTAMGDPDMGVWSYNYDVAGNLIQQTDFKQQRLSFAYDNLNRLTVKNSFGSNTPTLSDSFDSLNSANWTYAPAYQTVPFADSGNNVVKNAGTNADWNANFYRSSYSLANGKGMQIRFKVDNANANGVYSIENSDATYRRFGVNLQNGRIFVQYMEDGTNWVYPADLITNVQANTWYDLRIEVDDTNGFKVQAYQENNPSVQGTYTRLMPGGKNWRFRHWLWNNTSYLDDYQEYSLSATATPVANYYYDDTTNGNYGKGKRTLSSNGNATTRFVYDNRGQVIQTTYSGVPGVSGTRSFTTNYDSADRVTSLQYPNLANPNDPGGELLTYSYDAGWRPTQVCSNLTGNPCYASAAQYNALSQPTQLSFANALQQSWTYSSPMSRLSQLRVGTSGSPGSLFNRSYTYENVGNVKTISDGLSGQTQNFNYDDLDRLTQGWTTGGTNGYNESYSYDTIGNITSKAGTSYTYPAGGQARPHTPLTVGGQSYSYDGNGNLLIGGNRSYVWNAENKPLSVTGPDGVAESYTYDADGERVSRSRSGTTTFYFSGGMWEEDSAGTIRVNYSFGGKVVATRQRVSGVDTLTYLHGDHLGSVSLATSSSGTVASQQEFDPWGKVRLGGLSQTTLNYTGQRLDGTGLLYYHARMYDPGLGKFVSPDSIVPGAASGAGSAAGTLGLDDKVELRPLTVDFHEPGFVTKLGQENSFTTEKGFWFQLSDDDRQKAKTPFGPDNPQALNRYSYVLNNPIRYIDPTGHTIYMNHAQTVAYLAVLQERINALYILAAMLTGLGAGSTEESIVTALKAAGYAGLTVAAAFVLGAEYFGLLALQVQEFYNTISSQNGSQGVAIAADCPAGGSTCTWHVTDLDSGLEMNKETHGGGMTRWYWGGLFGYIGVDGYHGDSIYQSGRACTSSGENYGDGSTNFSYWKGDYKLCNS